MTRPEPQISSHRTGIWLHSIKLPQRIRKMAWLLLSGPYKGLTSANIGFFEDGVLVECKSLAMIEPKNGCCPGSAAVATFQCVRCWPRGGFEERRATRHSCHPTPLRAPRAQCDQSKHMVKNQIYIAVTGRSSRFSDGLG